MAFERGWDLSLSLKFEFFSSFCVCVGMVGRRRRRRNDLFNGFSNGKTL